MVVIVEVGRMSVKAGGGNVNCPLHDVHEKRVYLVNGKAVQVYVDGESASQWMNKLAIEQNAPTFPIGRRSKAVVLRENCGWGIWLNIGQQGFSQYHMWVICDEGLDQDELHFLIARLEKELEEEMDVE